MKTELLKIINTESSYISENLKKIKKLVNQNRMRAAELVWGNINLHLLRIKDAFIELDNNH